MSDILSAIEKLNHGLDQLVAAKQAIQESATELETLRVARVNGLDIDWEVPERVWLNGFACIHPTDAFAAELGRSIIRTVMQAYPHPATFTVRAS